MEKVLEDKNAICVYVAPTKALVNQVAGRVFHLKLENNK
jgi:superfamily II RNA helicase